MFFQLQYFYTTTFPVPHSAGIDLFCPPLRVWEEFLWTTFVAHSLHGDGFVGKSYQKLSKIKFTCDGPYWYRAWIREKDTTIHGVNRAEAQSYSKFEGNQRQSLAVCLFFAHSATATHIRSNKRNKEKALGGLCLPYFSADSCSKKRTAKAVQKS